MISGHLDSSIDRSGHDESLIDDISVRSDSSLSKAITEADKNIKEMARNIGLDVNTPPVSPEKTKIDADKVDKITGK